MVELLILKMMFLVSQLHDCCKLRKRLFLLKIISLAKREVTTKFAIGSNRCWQK
jgi:hypothetical protein